MSATETKLAADFLTDEMGGRHHRAAIFCDLQVAAEAVYAETEFEDDFAPDIREACKRIVEYEFRV